MRVHRSKEILHCILHYSYIIILLLIPLSDNFELSSPLFVTGNVGQDVILPCPVNFKTQVKEIQWNKKANCTIKKIYQFTASIGEAIYGQDYKARAVVSKEGLNTGDVSLKLEKVQMSDEGCYNCVVMSADDWVDQVQIVLHVENSEGHSSTSSCLNWMLPFILITIILFLVLIAALLYCKRKEKQMKAQMRDLENNRNLLEEQPQENRVLLSPFKIQDMQNQLESLKTENETLKTEDDILSDVDTFIFLEDSMSGSMQARSFN